LNRFGKSGKVSPAASQADDAALGALVKISTRKRRFIRAIEAMARPIVFLLDKAGYSRNTGLGKVQKILVLEVWNLGDIVMELPFLRNLRIHFPNARIALMTSPKIAQLIEDQELADEIIIVRIPWAQHYSRWKKYNPLSKSWIDLVRTLKFVYGQQFDLAFTARADIRENFILWITRVARRVGYGFGGGRFFLTDVATPDLDNPHFSSRWLRLIESIGKPILVRQPELRVGNMDAAAAREELARLGVREGDSIVGIHSGARSSTRQWGEENFARVGESLERKFPVKIVWFQDPNQISGRQNQFVTLSLPLRQFMSVLKHCELFVCSDSGPMHIATALNVPVVAVFGPTEPLWFGPLGAKNRIVMKPEFWCRPCFDYCIFDEPYCLRTIDVDSVIEAAARTLQALGIEPREYISGEQASPQYYDEVDGQSLTDRQFGSKR
jgi:ADP-heptose:LPS heptosyltransferase